MLKKALKLDRVHDFGDISLSQLLEMMDYLIELTRTYDHNTIIGPKPTTLICIFNLSGNRLSITSEKEQEKKSVK